MVDYCPYTIERFQKGNHIRNRTQQKGSEADGDIFLEERYKEVFQYQKNANFFGIWDDADLICKFHAMGIKDKILLPN